MYHAYNRQRCNYGVFVLHSATGLLDGLAGTAPTLSIRGWISGLASLAAREREFCVLCCQSVTQQYDVGIFVVAKPPPAAFQPHAAYDSISLNADHYTNFEGEHDHGIPNFDDSFIPMETQDELHGNNSVQDYRTNLVTVYKKAPDAPKRFRSSYVHFFMDFLEKKRQTPGLDGLVSWGVVTSTSSYSLRCANKL